MKRQNRFLIITIIIFIAFSFTCIRLIQTTLFPDDRLIVLNKRISNPRGNIYDTKGRLIAGVSSTSSLYARPGLLSDDLKNYLKAYLYNTGYFSEKELANFDRTNRNFVYIKRDMTPSMMEPVNTVFKALKKEKYIQHDELGITTEESRFYPYPFLEPIVGLLGRDGIGLYGIEYTYNDDLKQGYDLTISIDAEISRIAYEELFRVVKDTDADAGSVGIIDLKSREIITLVQVSTNNRTATTLSHIYEPGSVMKLFTAAFAMEQGIASTENPLFDDQTPFTVGNYTFSQPRYGNIPLATMLTKSANISFARLASQFGKDDYYLWLNELGFGQKPDLPLTSIERGILRQPNQWSALSRPMLGIGQEIGVTTLQLLIAASVIGGNGVAIPPKIIKHLRDNKGQDLYKKPQQTQTQLFHPLKAKELLYALEQAIQQGTGHRAAIEGIRIAGKTGTGMIAGEKGYSEGKNNTVFIGFLPIEDPRFAIVVAIHNPKGMYRSGGGVSAPLFADIARRILINSSSL